MGDNVKVIVRCRPLNSKEKSGGHKEAVQCDEVNGRVLIERPNDPPKVDDYLDISLKFVISW